MKARQIGNVKTMFRTVKHACVTNGVTLRRAATVSSITKLETAREFGSRTLMPLYNAAILDLDSEGVGSSNRYCAVHK